MKNTGKFKKIASIVCNVLLWIFVAFSLFITIMVFSAQSSKDGVPSIFGKSLISVYTDSMKDTFYAGDLLLVEKVAPEDVASLQPDDIILYHAPIDINGDGNVGDLNTHRILEHNKEEQSFVTKGDFNPIADNQGDHPYTVSYANVVGKYEGTRLPGVGHVINFLQTSLGFFLCIVLPLILFFLYELYNFITILVTERAKKNGTVQISKDAEEEIKRKAIEEYLKQQSQEAEIPVQPADPVQPASQPAPVSPAEAAVPVPEQPAEAPAPQPDMDAKLEEIMADYGSQPEEKPHEPTIEEILADFAPEEKPDEKPASASQDPEKPWDVQL